MAADATARFAIQLDDETSGAADAAAKALDGLRQKIEKDQQSLSALEKAMRSLDRGMQGPTAASLNLAKQIEAKRGMIAKSTADYLALGGTFQKLKKPANDVAKAVEDSGSSFDQLARATKKAGFGAPDAIMDLVGAVSTLPGVLITGAAAAVAFAAAIGVGLVAAIGGLIGMAFQAQEELEGVSQAAINVAKRSPIARTEIAKLSTELEKTGLKGQALEDALEKAVKAKYGAAATKSMMSLSVQLAKAKENVSGLFTGVKTAGLLEAVSKLLSFLDSSTVEGQALKQLLESLLNPILDGLAKAGPFAKQFFQGMIIGALQVAIAILLVKKRLEDIIGYKVDLHAVDWTKLGEAVAMAAGALILAAAVIGGIAAIVVAAALAPIVLGVAFAWLVGKVVEAAMAIPAAIGSMINYLMSRASAMVDVGAQFVAGLAEGIRNGLSDVVSAATGVAQGAINAVKNIWKSHSPSQVAIESGGNYGEGMAIGLEKSEGRVGDASAGLTEAVKAPQQGAALQSAGTGGGMTLHIGNLTISGIEGADDPSFVAKLAEALQQAAAMAAVTVAP